MQGHRGHEMGLKWLKSGFIGGFLLVGGLSLFEDPSPYAILPALMCGTVDGVALGVVGNLVGSRFPARTSYKVASNHWQFADINTLILK